MRDEHRQRLDERTDAWGLEVFGVHETNTSLIAFGLRWDQDVALKVIKEPGSEWRSGEVLEAFGGAGVARVFEQVEGAALLEWLRPGDLLADLAGDGYDERATEVLIEIVAAMAPRRAPAHVPTAETWATAFDTYLASEDDRIPHALVHVAQREYLDLCASQRATRLLHGDLHHGNVLFDYQRGWAAIDPKGIIAEVEFELGAALRNPIEWPDLFGDPLVIERRLDQFVRGLPLDRARIRRWAFAQAVLATIWLYQDGGDTDIASAWLSLANQLRS